MHMNKRTASQNAVNNNVINNNVINTDASSNNAINTTKNNNAINTSATLPHILVFDSGAGGLSITSVVRAKIPCTLTYVADNKHYPYGEQPSSKLENIILSTLCPIIQQHQPDLIIIACNTASTLILPALRARFTTPIIGVVPAIKPAAKHSKTKTIAVFATKETTQRSYTHNLINEHANGVDVILISTPMLVSAAENHLHGQCPQNAINNALHMLFSHPKANQIDTLVLACTHFPLLKKHIANTLKQQQKTIQLQDSGNAIANRAYSLLNVQTTTAQHGKTTVVLTLKDKQKQACYEQYLSEKTD